MKKVITQEQLLYLCDAEIKALKGCRISIEKKDGNTIEGIVNGFALAANPPHLVCDFILQDGMNISFGAIKQVTYEI